MTKGVAVARMRRRFCMRRWGDVKEKVKSRADLRRRICLKTGKSVFHVGEIGSGSLKQGENAITLRYSAETLLFQTVIVKDGFA